MTAKQKFVWYNEPQGGSSICADTNAASSRAAQLSLHTARAIYFFVKPDSLRFVSMLVGLAGHVPVRHAITRVSYAWGPDSLGFVGVCIGFAGQMPRRLALGEHRWHLVLKVADGDRALVGELWSGPRRGSIGRFGGLGGIAGGFGELRIVPCVQGSTLKPRSSTGSLLLVPSKHSYRYFPHYWNMASRENSADGITGIHTPR